MFLEWRHFGVSDTGRFRAPNGTDSSSSHYPKVDNDPLRMRRVCAACWLKVAVNRFARLISSMAMPLRERWFVFQIWNTFQQQSRIIMHGSEYPRLCERILTITAVCC